MPKISVVLPVYNGETYLKESIESVLNQSYRDFELIIVNDSSTDNSGKIAQEFEKQDKRIIYIHNKHNLKLPQSLNVGFTKATGQYLTWTSCDNMYLPDAFQTMLDAFEQDKKISLVYASMEILDTKGNKIGITEAGPAEDLILRNVVGACFLYRKSLQNEIGLYDISMFLCEDYEYWLRIARFHIIKPIHICLYQYRVHKKSLSSNHEKEIIAKGIKVQKRDYKLFIKTKKQAAKFYASLRARDIYNPFRQCYLLIVLFYSPLIFFKELYGLIARRFRNGSNDLKNIGRYNANGVI